MRRTFVGFGLVVLYLLALQGCVVREAYPPPPGPPPEPGFHHRQLRVLELAMSPDPAREGERIRFSVRLANNSSFSKRVTVGIRDRDQWVSEVSNVWVRPGTNEIVFPYTGYRFSRQDHCFTVFVDIDGNYRAVDLAREFCAQRTYGGWTLAGSR